MDRRVLAGLSILLAAWLAGCGRSERLSHAPEHRTTVPPTDGMSRLLAHSVHLGPVPATTSLSLLLLLRDRSLARQAADLAAMYDPRSAHYRRFKSPSQYAAAYGPHPKEVHRVRALLRRTGLRSTWRRGDPWLVVHGPAATIERVFAANVERYRSPQGSTFYAASRTPAIPHWLQFAVRGAGRIDSYFGPRAAAVPTGGLSPSDLVAAYNMKPLRDLGLDGSGQTVAFVEIDGYAQSDLNAFTQKFKLPEMHPVLAYGASLPPGGETEMDLQVVHAIAPAAKLVLYNCSTPCTTSKIVSVEDRAVVDNPRGIISISLEGCEAGDNASQALAERAPFDKAAQLGESVFVATGDEAGFICLRDATYGTPPSDQTVGTSLPATAPGVTAVGGTRLSVNQNGSWYNETVWEDPARTVGSGGGVSQYYAQPSWQKAPGTGAAVSLFNPRHRRMVPDVAADADSNSGAAIYTQGSWSQGGGTSHATPIWAGMTALINQYLQRQGQQNAGFMNPALYSLASGSPQFPPFHDIVVGTNLVYPAARGFDLATGLGSPDAWNLARDLESYLKNGKP